MKNKVKDDSMFEKRIYQK